MAPDYFLQITDQFFFFQIQVNFFEKVIHSRLHFLEQHNHLFPYQFGFRINYSNNNALITIAERIQKQLDAGNYTAAVLVDLKKAFNTVDHNILLEQLDYYGIRSVLKDWFSSYLETLCLTKWI